MAELAPQEEIVALRKPEQIFTQNYLNDPIRFDTDARFVPDTVLRQLGEKVIVNRDQAEFAVFEMNAADAQWYPVTMFRPVYHRFDLERAVKRQIRQLFEE